MAYEECLEKTKNKLVETTLSEIIENNDGFFQCWIQAEVDHEFGNRFVNVFKEFFGENIHQEDERTIYTYGKQMAYLLQACVDSGLPDKKMLKLAKCFVSDQVDDFGNWCGDVCMRMDEDEEDEDEPK